MTSKERVLKAINHEKPDRPPLFVTLTPQAAEKLSKKLNLPYEPPIDSLLSTRILHTDLLTELGNDCVGIASCAPPDSPTETLKGDKYYSGYNDLYNCFVWYGFIYFKIYKVWKKYICRGK